jgi:sugar lactone lactonase YvrE
MPRPATGTIPRPRSIPITPLGAIVIPEVSANLCFGGHHHNRLFICASTSYLYAIDVGTRGVEM